MELNIEKVEILLLIAAVVAIAARRLHIPYTIALVLAGAALAVSPFAPEINLSKELIFTIFLPPLIYEAALYIRWRELSQNLPVILAFAIAGVLISTALTAIGMHWLIGWPWQSAILFGALIAATDPVSVIATFVWLLRPYQTDKDLLPSKKKNRPIQKLDSKSRMGTLVEYRTI